MPRVAIGRPGPGSPQPSAEPAGTAPYRAEPPQSALYSGPCEATMPSPSKRKTASKKTTAVKQAATKKPAKRARPPARATAKPGARKKAGPAATDAADASRRIDEKIASLEDWRGERLAEIRSLIHEVEPGVIEEWKWMGTAVWSHHGMFANANPLKDKVKVTFHHGAQLKDPHHVFNNGFTGNKWRAVDLRESDALDRSGFKALVKEALEYNASHDVPKSKGSNAALLRAPKRRK